MLCGQPWESAWLSISGRLTSNHHTKDNNLQRGMEDLDMCSDYTVHFSSSSSHSLCVLFIVPDVSVHAQRHKMCTQFFYFIKAHQHPIRSVRMCKAKYHKYIVVLIRLHTPCNMCIREIMKIACYFSFDTVLNKLFHLTDVHIYCIRQNNNLIYKNDPIQKFTYPWILILSVISWMIHNCFYILW